MTLQEALQWAAENCSEEATERLRSRAAVSRLVGEVLALREILAVAFEELNGCGDHEDVLENTHYCGRCDSSIDRNAELRKLIANVLNTKD
jgi:hypothetical protein